jgi:hypothetical protein
VFHSVSKARAASIWIATTPVEMRSSVRVQREDSSSSIGCGQRHDRHLRRKDCRLLLGRLGPVRYRRFLRGWLLRRDGLRQGLRRRRRRRQRLGLRLLLRACERRSEHQDGGCEGEPRNPALNHVDSRMFH